MLSLFARKSSKTQQVANLSPAETVPYLTDLDAPLMQLPFGEALTLRHLHTGTHVFGGIGSGKTSSMNNLATQMLYAGMGGLVLCGKENEAKRWQALAVRCGRANSVIMFGNPNGMQFNFLTYELLRPNGGGQTENMVELFMTMLEFSQSQQGDNGNNQFWQQQAKLFLTHMFNLLIAGTGRLTIDDMTQFLASLPRSKEQRKDYGGFSRLVTQQAASKPIIKRHQRDLQAASHFFGHRVRMYDDKTYANIMATLDSMLFPFQTGKLRELFCNRLDFVPEMAIEHGCIIIMDMSVEADKFIGKLAQLMMKTMFQQAAISRPKFSDMRSSFLWVDEAANFYNHNSDNTYQSLCRESRICSVYMAQNIGSYFTAMRGANARELIENFIGNFGVQFFFANMDYTTNKYASDMIGRSLQQRYSHNWNQSSSHGESFGQGVNESESHGKSKGESSGANSNYTVVGFYEQTSRSRGYSHSYNVGSNESITQGSSQNYSENYNHSRSKGGGSQEVMEMMLEPNHFVSQLRTGGVANDCIVDGIMVRAGGFTGGKNYIPVSFKQ